MKKRNPVCKYSANRLKTVKNGIRKTKKLIESSVQRLAYYDRKLLHRKDTPESTKENREADCQHLMKMKQQLIYLQKEQQLYDKETGGKL